MHDAPVAADERIDGRGLTSIAGCRAAWTQGSSHRSTFDQLFTDQKFEAYRVLGYFAGQSAMRAMDGT
jgi:hypothetical protein